MEGYTVPYTAYSCYARYDEQEKNPGPAYGVGPNWPPMWNNDMGSMTYHNQSSYLPNHGYGPQPAFPYQQGSQPAIESRSTPRIASQSNFVTHPSTPHDFNSKGYSYHNPATPERVVNGQVPTIVTQFASRSNTFVEDEEEGLSIMSGTDDMATLSADWMKMDSTLSPDMMSDPGTAGGRMSATSNLQEAFQWHSPTTRRTSISSNASGPTFSPHGTPMTFSQRDSSMGTPYSQAGSWTPRSMTSNQFADSSPQSPSNLVHARLGKYNQSWSRMKNQYLPPNQRKSSGQSNTQGSWQTLPSRPKPRIEHAFSDSSIPSKQAFAYSSYARPAQGRRRAISAVYRRGEPLSTNHNPQQLDLPPYQISDFFISPSPEMPQTGFSTSLEALQPQSVTSHPTAVPAFQSPYALYNNKGTEFIHTSQENAPPPPESDFIDELHKPVPQQPQFDGDIYTPLWKRRDKAGNWEGWCHLCKPGAWLSMKTSRYWDDKKRNHGICANTKRKFPDPLEIRVVDLQGNVVDIQTETHEGSDTDTNTSGSAWVVSEVDGSLRKRQGLCGSCQTWVMLDGPRTKVKGKTVGWWIHCYECLAQSKKP